MRQRELPSRQPTRAVWSVLRHPLTAWALRPSKERLVTAQDLPGQVSDDRMSAVGEPRERSR